MLSTIFRDLLSLPPPECPCSIADPTATPRTPPPTPGSVGPSADRAAQLAIPTSTPSDPEGIPVDASAFDLRVLLDLLTQPPASVPSVDFEIVQRLLALCDKYDMLIVTERILYRLQDIAYEAPWGIFCIASRFDDHALARTAISALKHEMWFVSVKPYGDIDKIPMDRIRECGVEFYAGLVRAFAIGSRKRGGQTAINFEQLAADFEV